MFKSRHCQIMTILFIFAALVPGCERTVEQEVIQPIKAMHGQKEAASLEAALANVRIVRSALMRYPVISSENLYPADTAITGYDSLRDVLTDENLPGDMSDLMWDPSYGVRYTSDGYTFTFQVKTAGDGKVITATTNGVKVEE